MDWTALDSMFKLIGYAAILVALFIIMVRVFVEIIKGERAAFERILSQQTSQFEKFLAKYEEQFKASQSEQALRNKENFEVLGKFADGIEFLGGQVTSVKSEIATNQYCPLVRKGIEKP